MPITLSSEQFDWRLARRVLWTAIVSYVLISNFTTVQLPVFFAGMLEILTVGAIIITAWQFFGGASILAKK